MHMSHILHVNSQINPIRGSGNLMNGLVQRFIEHYHEMLICECVNLKMKLPKLSKEITMPLFYVKYIYILNIHRRFFTQHPSLSL